jgi:alpha-tubulin suppressor-like RCC1 family protein
MKDNTETDVDCGGSFCAPCGFGQVCSLSSDCQTQACVGSVCVEPTCSDLAQDGRETSVDCGGGVCPPCPNGTQCHVAGDCQSKTCLAGSCIDATSRGGQAPIAIASGAFHSCALLASGAVKCWGNNEDGQLGNGSTSASTTPVNVTGLSGASAIASSAHAFSSCARMPNGKVECWGTNAGTGPSNTTNQLTPVLPPNVYAATSVSVGTYVSCALTQLGVACWGDNRYGSLGDGTTTTSATPVAAHVPGNVVALTAGDWHVCALIDDGSVQCWGVGFGTSPSPVAGLARVASLAAGDGHTCALLNDHTVKCWGDNSFGQLGNGTTTSSSTPVAVSGLTTAVAVTSGGDHTCALLSQGTVQCWGADNFGQLGDGQTYPYSTVPVNVSGLSTITAISAGSSHTCALTRSSPVACWGLNADGQLGNGTTASSSVPVLVSF